MSSTNNPSRKFTRALGPFDFEPASFTTEYPPGYSGGLPFYELLAGAACMGEWIARSRATGRVVGGVVDWGTPGKDRWTFQAQEPVESSYHGRSNQLSSRPTAARPTAARSFPALLELIA